MKYLYFIYKNLTRKKIRTILTVLSIVVAFLLYGLLRSLSGAFDHGAQVAGEDRLITVNKVTFILPLPYAYLAKVKALEGVEKVTVSNWLGAYYQEPKNFFAQLAVNADVFFDIYKDTFTIPPEQLTQWQHDRVGAVIGRDLVKKYNWKVGDRIPLISMFPQKNGSTSWEFVIDGIYDAKNKNADTNHMYFHYDYFDKTRQYGEGTLGWLIVKVKDPKESAKVAAAIDALFANSSAETKTSSEKEFAKSFAKQFGDIGFMTTLILGAVFFTMLLVAGNTMAQSFRERIPEFAILKTLGFSDVTVMLLVLAESLILCLAGGLTGLLLAKVTLAIMAEGLVNTLPGLIMTWNVIVSGILLVIAFGIVTGFIPAIQGLRLNIIAALRRH